MLVLTVIEGPDSGRTFELPADEPQLLGRSSEALPLSDNTVSRRHAELTPDEGEWFVRDLHSQNGTYVNGEKIGERVRLKPGDHVRVGSTVMVFGSTVGRDAGMVRLLSPDQVDAEIEAVLLTNEDSVVLAEPDPAMSAVAHLNIIYKLTRITAQTLDEKELLSAVMELVFSQFRPERGVIMTYSTEDDTDELIPSVIKHQTPPLDKDEKIGVSQTILQHTLDEGEGVLCSNAMTDPRFRAGDSVQLYHIRSAICSPIRFRDRTFGAIYIDSSIANYTFTEDQLALMNAIGSHTALALTNIDLHRDRLHTERLAAIGETVASLSHSIKNILQGLRGGADVVDMGLKKEDLKVTRSGWGILKRNLDRIVTLTMNMLAYSRQRQIEYELTPMGPLIEDCCSLFESTTQEKQIALITDLDPEMPPIPIDPHMIHQALMNLIGNAVEAVEPGTGAVTVRTTYRITDPLLGATPAYAIVDVIDNGPGIPKERHRRIFEPFQTTKGIRGTGLGLAVTKRIIEEHRGRIELTSEPGEGAVFRLILPCEPVELDPSKTAESRATGLDMLRDV